MVARLKSRSTIKSPCLNNWKIDKQTGGIVDLLHGDLIENGLNGLNEKIKWMEGSIHQIDWLIERIDRQNVCLFDKKYGGLV